MADWTRKERVNQYLGSSLLTVIDREAKESSSTLVRRLLAEKKFKEAEPYLGEDLAAYLEKKIDPEKLKTHL